MMHVFPMIHQYLLTISSTNTKHEQKLRSKSIRASNSLYSLPTLLAASCYRFVIDHGKFNQINIKDYYPLPNMEGTINQLCGHLAM